MAKAVAAGRRVVLVTGTRGELGEIVVPELDTPDNHRRLGELRAVELERAMGHLGVTEWENLGYRDSDMMGRSGNLDPRSFWRADLDEAAGRLVWLIRRYQPDVVTTYNEYGGYGHPDHIRVHDVAVAGIPASGRPGLVSGAARRGARWDGTGRSGRRRCAVAAVEALRTGVPGVVLRIDARVLRAHRPAEPVGATRRRHTGAAGRDGGRGGEDARARRDDHRVDRHQRRATRAANGRPWPSTGRRSQPTSRWSRSASTDGASYGRRRPTSCASRAWTRRRPKTTCSPGSPDWHRSVSARYQPR